MLPWISVIEIAMSACATVCWNTAGWMLGVALTPGCASLPAATLNCFLAMM
jgi:hypothetical protein